MKKIESLSALSIFLAAGLCFISCHGGEGQAAQATNISAGEPSAPTVEVARVISQKLQAEVRLPAEIMPYEQVDVLAKVTGFVKWIGVVCPYVAGGRGNPNAVVLAVSTFWDRAADIGLAR